MKFRRVKPFVPPIIWDSARAVIQRFRQHDGIREIECLGLRWRLDMESVISQAIVQDEIWERNTTNLVRDFVKPSMRVLSVGANFGYYALLMARQVGPTGHVYAFEPAQKFIDYLKWNVEANGFSDRVTICPFGLSDSTASATLNLCPDTASMHIPPNTGIIGSETIELKPLDAIASGLGIEKIDFALVDVDGHEAAFLKGGRKTLERDTPPMILEISPSNLYFAGSSSQEVASLLRHMGYAICSEQTRQPYKREWDFLWECGNFNGFSNVLAIRRQDVSGAIW
jgi:FkbM family methyltransferase